VHHETDGGPGRADETRYEDAHSQDLFGEEVQRLSGCVEEGFVFKETEGAVEDGEEAGYAWKGLDPVAQVCAETGGVVWVEEGAGEGFYSRMGWRSKWRHRSQGLGQSLRVGK